MLRQLLELPNLISLSRVFLVPFIGYYLAQNDNQSTLIAFILILIAALTDWLDGYLARKMNKISRLGVALDPVADKVFAGLLVILLIYFREFPIWLAVMIIGRDLLIMVAGGLALKKRGISVPSNLTGKYAFTFLAALLCSHVIRFEFGILVLTFITVGLLVLSIFNYSMVYFRIVRNIPQKLFQDRPIYQILRVTSSLIILIILLFKLYKQFL
jgi:CDP-diacylglycerol--glycerol-3-phosphate 3-phosphatidyltransferase